MPEHYNKPSRFNPDALIGDNEEETVIIVARTTGKEVGEFGAVNGQTDGGIILRGEDADKYLAGEDVMVPGVGITNKDAGIVQSFGPTNTPKNSPAAVSMSAFKKGESIHPDELEDQQAARKSAAKPSDKSRTSTPEKKPEDKGATA